MKTVTLEKFQRLTHLPDSVLLKLLKSNRLPVVVTESGEIEVVEEKLDIADLSQAIARTTQSDFESHSDLFEEELAALVASELGSILQEVVTRLSEG